ncbi:MAG TPA: ATP-binding protein [Acidimicrobiia bacterium]|nr:ATP-binding protein [Acidimicrobiia bacterium]
MLPLERDFDAEPEAVRQVRHFLEGAAERVARLDDIVIVATELASNVVRHARTDFSVRLTTGADLIRLEVSDGSSIVPAVEDLADRKFGLRIVEAAAHRWGIESRPTGKTVWVEFLAHPSDP